MSDISKSSSNNSSKRRINEIDDTIEYLTHEVNNLNDILYKSEFECSLMTVKLKREKVKALAAVARSQVLLADMEVLIAECDLLSDVERLKNCKKMKLDRDEGKSQQTITQNPSAPTTKSASVQTMKTMSDKKKKRKHSSSMKPPYDISSDETMLVQSIHESTESLVEKQSRLTLELLNKPPANTSDTEVSLSSSIKAEFNEPYTKTQAQVPEKKASNKKHKSNKKVDSKSKSANVTKQAQSPAIATKSVAEINRSVSAISNSVDLNSCTASTPKKSKPYNSDRKLTACTSTYVPIRHNLPLTVTQPKNIIAPQPSTSSPCLYLNIPFTQTGIYNPSRPVNSQCFNFYGSKQ